jgi:hypothetical protein
MRRSSSNVSTTSDLMLLVVRVGVLALRRPEPIVACVTIEGQNMPRGRSPTTTRGKMDAN